jgi:hypothetical protein
MAYAIYCPGFKLSCEGWSFQWMSIIAAVSSTILFGIEQNKNYFFEFFISPDRSFFDPKINQRLYAIN